MALWDNTLLQSWHPQHSPQPTMINYHPSGAETGMYQDKQGNTNTAGYAA